MQIIDVHINPAHLQYVTPISLFDKTPTMVFNTDGTEPEPFVYLIAEFEYGIGGRAFKVDKVFALREHMKREQRLAKLEELRVELEELRAPLIAAIQAN